MADFPAPARKMAADGHRAYWSIKCEIGPGQGTTALRQAGDYVRHVIREEQE